MKPITSQKEFKAAQQRVYDLMNKGEGNLTADENSEVIALGMAAQAYEEKQYQISTPRTLYGMIELRMFERKIKQAQLAKKLNLSETKLSMILHGKQKPDVTFLKGIRKELEIDADFILDHV
jgi:HTH-type transcriptional regulator/antitoxin HigA